MNAVYMGTRGGQSAINLVHTLTKLGVSKYVDAELVAAIKCVEAKAMALCAELFYKASLMRTEGKNL